MKPLPDSTSTYRNSAMGEWTTAVLGDIAALGFGKTPPRAESRFWGRSVGHAWATIADLRQDPVTATAEVVSDVGLPYAGRVVSEGGLMMSFKLTVGRVARAGIDLLTNEAIVSVVGRPGLADDRWLYHALPAIASGGVTDTAVKGATLNKFKLERLLVALPPLREQRRIAEILDTIDETIRAIQRVVDKQSAVVTGLSGVLFTTDCERVPLAELSKRITYGFTNPMPTTPVGPLMLTAADVGYRRILHRQARRTTESAFRDLLSDKSRPSAGDILVTKDGTLGRVAVLGEALACVNQSVAVISLLDPAGSDFVAEYLLSPSGQRALLAGAGGSTIKHLYVSTMADLLIPWPDSAVRSRVVGAIRAAVERADAESAALSKLRAVRTGLAADLLSGRVRTVAE
jgi:type I restriction enzyme S subunit